MNLSLKLCVRQIRLGNSDQNARRSINLFRSHRKRPKLRIQGAKESERGEKGHQIGNISNAWIVLVERGENIPNFPSEFMSTLLGKRFKI